MLLEMQNAMNNMMSNNSQLHTMLHGQQNPSDASSPPSSSSSFTASDSSSCSSPSSPQGPQDSESVISMDTNSSSASSCASDSGEDEAVVTASGAHPDAFAYRQRSQSLARPDQRSLVAMPTEAGCDSRMEEPAEQESWNCWNRNTAVEGYRHRSHSPHVTNAAYREEYQRQQRNSAPCSDPAEDGKPWHRGNDEPSSCLNNRTRLVTDLLKMLFLNPFKSFTKVLFCLFFPASPRSVP